MIMATKSIDIYQLIHKDSAVLPLDGEVLYNSILSNLDKNEALELNFKNLKFITSAFLNASIGKFLLENPSFKDKLFYSYDEEQSLDVRIKRVVDIATDKKLRDAHNQAIEEVLA